MTGSVARWQTVLFLAAFALVAPGLGPGAPAPAAHAASLPLAFEANQGQTDPRVRFLARAAGYTLFLTATETVLSLRSNDQCPMTNVQWEGADRAPKAQPHGGRPTPNAVLRMQLAGADPGAPLRGEAELPGKVHYYRGRDPGQWRRNLPTFARVRRAGVYPGIDVLYYGQDRQLEYDFVVAPGADPQQIRLCFDAGERRQTTAPRLAENGDLVLRTAAGEVRQQRPVAYQEIDGRRRPVAAEYVLPALHAPRSTLWPSAWAPTTVPARW